MTQETPVEDYKLASPEFYKAYSFDNGIDRRIGVSTKYSTVYNVTWDLDDEDEIVRISTALTPDQAEAYATLLLYAAKLAREGN